MSAEIESLLEKSRVSRQAQHDVHVARPARLFMDAATAWVRYASNTVFERSNGATVIAFHPYNMNAFTRFTPAEVIEKVMAECAASGLSCHLSDGKMRFMITTKEIMDEIDRQHRGLRT